MPQSLAKVTVHIVFSTKQRIPWLKDPEIRQELYAYMAAILKAHDSPAIVIDGVADHVHILCLLSRKHPLKKIVEEIKKQPSKWIKTKGPRYRNFYWQKGYGAFSVSQSSIEPVRQYILNQETHHQKRSFQDEFRQICEMHGVKIDERYVWQ